MLTLTSPGPTPAPSPPTIPDARPADIRHLVVIGHPGPASFNHSVANAYADTVISYGQTAIVRDLYATGFDPLLKPFERPGTPGFRLSPDVETELAEVRRAAVIVLVYPIWFGTPPAIIKGYVERVLGSGLPPRRCNGAEGEPELAGKDLVILSTSGTTRPWLEESGQWLGLRQAFDLYLQTVFHLASVEHIHADAIVAPLEPSYAAECLANVEQQARITCARLLSAAHSRRKCALLDQYFTQQARHA